MLYAAKIDNLKIMQIVCALDPTLDELKPRFIIDHWLVIDPEANNYVIVTHEEFKSNYTVNDSPITGDFVNVTKN